MIKKHFENYTAYDNMMDDILWGLDMGCLKIAAFKKAEDTYRLAVRLESNGTELFQRFKVQVDFDAIEDTVDMYHAVIKSIEEQATDKNKLIAEKLISRAGFRLNRIHRLNTGFGSRGRDYYHDKIFTGYEENGHFDL